MESREQSKCEPATNSGATETNNNQAFDWNRYNSFSGTKKFIGYSKRYKTKHKAPLKANEIHQVEQLVFQFVQTESSPKVSNLITNSKEISRTMNIAKFSPLIAEDGIIRVKSRLKHSNLDYNDKHPIVLIASTQFYNF